MIRKCIYSLNNRIARARLKSGGVIDLPIKELKRHSQVGW